MDTTMYFLYMTHSSFEAGVFSKYFSRWSVLSGQRILGHKGLGGVRLIKIESRKLVQERGRMRTRKEELIFP